MAGADRTKPITKKRGSGGRLAISVSGGGGILIAGGALIALGAAFLFRRSRANKKTPPPPPPPPAPKQAEEIQAKEANDVVKAFDAGSDLGLQSLVSLVKKESPVDTCEITAPDVEATSEKSEIKEVVEEEVEENHIEEKETIVVETELEVAESEPSVEEGSSEEAVWPAEMMEQEAESAAMEKEDKAEEESDAAMEKEKKAEEESDAEPAIMEFEKEVVMTKMMMGMKEKNTDAKVLILLLALIMALGILCSYVHSLSSKE